MGGLLRRRRTNPTEQGSTDAPARRRVRVCGQVTRMRARPTSGLPALAVSVTDESGTAVAVWTGRRAIGGIALGRRLAIDGVAVRRGDQLEFMNPEYILLPR